MHDQHADIEWTAQGIPFSRRFGDPYFSQDNGPAETRHVFLAGNGLPDRFCNGFSIAELGFGTGLNLLVTWAAWRQAGAPGQLYFTSFEAFFMSLSDLAKAHQKFPELRRESTFLLAALAAQPTGRYALQDGLTFELITGDARTTLPRWQGAADAWFLDGFAPAKNPELWEPDLLAQVASHTKPGGTAATYSAAGHVRRGLADAGFTVSRLPGHGRKRHMSAAILPATKAQP
ncbi:MAG: tRNA (5-methylaminomethyl-2-thiouridine)(34)-methyltransferase MnmD [Rhodobacteraceae bacterium]|nr:tRNA (5-methylaminomethyl-2-thiouridine)(34)-methyltransferase MnmD [Paracoccaceae bacterium]